ncbi:MAG: choice-of-anchor tandem repeat NxxGxxAF-containing protein [Polyangiaceae bacterium]
MPIADTSDRFSDFAPYAAAIDDAGAVAFQATLAGGRTGIFTGSGGAVASRSERSKNAVTRFYSHPDIDHQGASCVYGALASGHEAILLLKDGAAISLADTSGPFKSIGPLGPTMNDHGTVVFRADTKSGRSGVFTTSSSGSIVTIADTSSFAGFQGLPVITNKGTIVFRADLSTGGHGIYLSRARGHGHEPVPEAVVETGARFRTLGLFPCANNEDTVVFAATLIGGGAGIFRASNGDIRANNGDIRARSGDVRAGDGDIRTIADTNSAFESFRGALINDSGTVIFYATPRGGQLGIYAGAGADHVRDAVLSIGDPLFGSTVVELALNPVSINQRGQLAIRIRLANTRQLIVRADPAV